jgi:hypothetical protein
MPDHSQFNIDRTDPGRWTITFSNPPITCLFLQRSSNWKR